MESASVFSSGMQRRQAPTTPPAPAATDNLITVRDLQARLTLSRSTLWRMARDGELPRPIALTSHRVAWRERDIAAWITTRAEAGRQ